MLLRGWLDQQCQGLWKGRRGSREWPPRSPDLWPLDFFLWVYRKGLLYSRKIRDLDHLQRWITAACIAAMSTKLKRMWQHWATGLRVYLDHNSEHVENTLSNGIFPRCSKQTGHCIYVIRKRLTFKNSLSFNPQISCRYRDSYLPRSITCRACYRGADKSLARPA